ncbi:MAG: archaeosortase/exosortase family protein, partial [Hyphomicrobiales bacterium]|nr:archaeosortase/exosortase family protein [Hyphomicrobiales bacterium]
MSIDSLKSTTMARAPARAPAKDRGVSLVHLALMAASFVLAYLPTYLTLVNGPWRTEQEGHGPLILLAAAWLAWRRRDDLSSVGFKPALVAGWLVLLGGLLLMAVARSQGILMIEVATQIPVLLGCLLLIGGWPLARLFRFPLAFLIFAVPPPGWLMDAFTVPLK